MATTLNQQNNTQNTQNMHKCETNTTVTQTGQSQEN